jgi:CRP-like cAMP-binding protein
MSSNALIGSLSQGDRASLGPHLKSVFLPAKSVLFEAGDLVPAVYFPVSAIISLVVTLSTGDMVEAAMVGRDGVVGASSALDGRVTLSRAIVQIEGDVLVCEPEKLRRAAFQSEKLISRLIRHEQTLFAQAQQSTACMSAHDVQSRMCRWLLRSRDLAGTDTLNFTQEFLAEMLGVRRSSVTGVCLTLQGAGLIQYRRGKIRISSVELLREMACECYETTKSHYDLLLAPDN